MASQLELHQSIERLMDEGRFEEANALVHELPSISADEMDRILDSAPFDDEPLSPGDLEALAEGRRLRELSAIDGRGGRKAG